ncbi:MAG: Crp/Fnr family transcriptional regulator [Stellaceae bacterium]
MTAAGKLVPNVLTTSELFARLRLAALGEAIASARTRRLPKDSRIFSQGDACERAHVLIEGSVRITQTGGDGEQIIVRFIGPGETFGTVGMFTNGRYPADAVTLADSTEASWGEAELFELMDRHPRIAINVIRVVGKRLQEVQERLRELSTQRVERRVAHAVLRLAHQAGRNTADGTAIEFPLRRKDVADISGTTVHTASRILTAWEKDGLLISQNRRLIICNPSALLRIAEDLTD